MTPSVRWVTLHEEQPARGFWDQGLAETTVAAGWETVEDGPADLMIVPGRMNYGREEELAPILADARAVIVTGDEEARFSLETAAPGVPYRWVQMPGIDFTPGDRDRAWPLGSPPRLWPDTSAGRDFDWCFAGQVTHDRRRAAVGAALGVPHGLLLASDRFAAGVPQETYADLLGRSRLALCPSGPVHVETFRMYEALHAGCLPILDALTPDGRDWSGWWERVHGIPPAMPVVRDWSGFPALVPELLDGWQRRANRVGAWWNHRTLDLHDRVFEQAGGTPEPVTIVVSMNAIPSHPDLGVLRDTFISLCRLGPKGRLIVMCDGLAPGQEHMAGDYEIAIAELLDMARSELMDVVIFDDWQHQANMTRQVLATVTTPLMFFVEHDTPLVGERPPWEELGAVIRSGAVNMVRLHHEASVLDEHRYLMVGDGPSDIGGLPLWPTIQWSQRPHLASTAWYRAQLDRWFPPDCRTFIEDRIYGPITEAPWEDYRLAIYTPPGDIKRSTHLDGRAGAAKAPALW